jgi:RNA polymerase sigma-70 factor (ECF subfamily)
MSDRTIQTESDADTLEHFRDRLRLFAARRLGNWAEAEDVAQEVLRRALEALGAGRITDPAALPGFLFQTARHVCQHHGRSAGRQARALRRVGATAGEEDPSSEVDPLARLISEERALAVRSALGGLNESDRELLSLTYGDALGTSEIGRRLGISEGNVRVRRHRALRRLGELLGVTTGSHREP